LTYKIEPKYIPNDGVKLNIGCGRDIRKGFINLDHIDNPGVDVVHDWEYDRKGGLIFPFLDNTFSFILARDVMEHVPHRVPDLKGEFFFHFINDLIRISQDGARWEVISPHRPEALGAAGHTRLIDRSTFIPWMEEVRGRGSAERGVGGCRLHCLACENHRQWDFGDPLRYGRSIVKRIYFEVQKNILE
jgi:hypothetical protein